MTRPGSYDYDIAVLSDFRYPGGDREIRAQWLDRFAGWLRSGDITFPHVSVPGIEAAPRALHDMMNGRHLGTVVVAL